MKEKWDYAELSKTAKDFGGPEKYIDFLEIANRQKGRSEMLPWIGVTALGASLLTVGTIKIVNIIKSRRGKKEEEIEEIKRELIEGVEECEAKNNEVATGGEKNE